MIYFAIGIVCVVYEPSTDQIVEMKLRWMINSVPILTHLTQREDVQIPFLT